MRIIAALFIGAALSACAPEPTTPSDESLAGVWTSNTHLYTMSNFRMNVVQEERGIVSGTWSAKTGEGDGGCSVSTPCDIGGELIGRNTVAQVEIHFLGSGKFEGALLEQNSLRGIFIVGASYDTISFVRTGQ